MDSHAPRSSSLVGSLRSFADGLLASAQERIQLLAIELQEEKFRLIQIVLWVSGLVLLALLAVVFASLALVVVFWEARVAVVLCLAGFYLIGFISVALAFRRYLRRQPRPFAATIGEIEGDRACIRTES